MRTTQKTGRRNAFTLIEMVGVLAVIAILAALLIPKIFAAINESRINNTIASYNSVKSATMTYFGKYGKFGGVAGDTTTNFTAAMQANWDANVLLPEGLIEKPFQPKMGDGAYVECVTPGASGTDFDLSAGGTKLGATSGNYCIACVITNVSLGDAWELSNRIDGPTLTTNKTDADLYGAVKYDPADTQKRVYIYVGHK